MAIMRNSNDQSHLVGGRLGGGGMEQKGKMTHGHGQQCGDGWGVGNSRRLNSNGEIYSKY